jgi:hypothetical protein
MSKSANGNKYLGNSKQTSMIGIKVSCIGIIGNKVGQKVRVNFILTFEEMEVLPTVI